MARSPCVVDGGIRQYEYQSSDSQSDTLLRDRYSGRRRQHSGVTGRSMMCQVLL